MSATELSGCVIVTGMPGAGKSTVTALAARLLPRAAQIKGDDVARMIVSGAVWFMGTPRHEARRQYELVKRNMCALTNNFIDHQFTVLMDGRPRPSDARSTPRPDVASTRTTRRARARHPGLSTPK